MPESGPGTPNHICQVLTTVIKTTLKYSQNVSPLCYSRAMSNRVSHRRSAEHNRIVQERRRSSAAQPHKNKAKYSRKAKHRNRFVTD
jgi:hypothetical protein